MQSTFKRAALAMAISSAGATLLGAVPSQAYSVTAEADTSVYIYGQYGRGYNASSYDNGSIPGGPGFTTIGGGCGPGFAACSIGGYGNTQTSATLTAATEATSVNVTTLPSYYYPAGLTASGSAFATANLASGSVGVASEGAYLDCCGVGSGQAGGQGESTAENVDSLHFSVAGASASTVTIIGVDFHVDGVVDPFTPAGDSFADLTTILQLGGGFFEARINSGPTAYTPVLTEGPPPSGWLTESLSPDSPGDFTFHGTLALTGATQDLGVVEYLEGTCGLGTSCDYSHTAALSFSLPSGVTFTSDSGVFLTAPTGGVPEPATWALMLVGLGGLGAALRRSRNAVALA